MCGSDKDLWEKVYRMHERKKRLKFRTEYTEIEPAFLMRYYDGAYWRALNGNYENIFDEYFL